MFQLYLFAFLYFGNNWQLIHGQGKKSACFSKIVSASSRIFVLTLLILNPGTLVKWKWQDNFLALIASSRRPSGGFSSASLPVAYRRRKARMQISKYYDYGHANVKNISILNATFIIMALCWPKSSLLVVLVKNGFKIALQCFIRSPVTVIFNAFHKIFRKLPYKHLRTKQLLLYTFR